MVKWKKMNKKMAGLLLGVMMLFTASTTAFAYVDESAEASKVETTQTDQSTDKEEKKDEAASTNEVLPEDGTDQGTAFTTPGNGEVKDDITDDSTKEFLTVTTKNNNTFYIVIDRSATSQNVYMLCSCSLVNATLVISPFLTSHMISSIFSSDNCFSLLSCFIR